MKDLKVQTDKSEDYMMTDNNHLTKADDKYMASIDLSNACREFYQARKLAAEAVKEKLSSSGRPRAPKQKSSIDVAMETLRSEMASLMDQDLSLMKQLLTLNEAIEDLKWQKQYYHSQSSLSGSSCDLNESDWSVSETDMFDSENEAPEKVSKPVKSCVTKIDITEDVTNIDNGYTSSPGSPTETHFNTSDIPTELDLFMATHSTSCHSEQNSFDSGIHESVLRDEIAV